MDLSFLGNLTETQLGAGGVGLLIFSIVFGIIKGVMRIALGMAGLVAGAVAFWFAFRHGDSIASKFVAEPSAMMPFGIAGGAALTTYLAVRHGVGLLLKPVIGTIDGFKNKKVLAGFLGLGIGGAGLYGGGSASHQVDAMSFLKEQRNGEEVSWLNKVLAKTQESWFGELQQNTDPTATGYKCDLVKLLSIAKFKGDGSTNETVKSAIREPDIQALLRDSDISQSLESGDFHALFRNEKLSHFLDDKGNKALLQGIDWRSILSK